MIPSKLTFVRFSFVFVGIMGDFEWRPLVKQLGIASEDMPSPLTITPESSGEEGGQARVDPPRSSEADDDEVVKVTLDVLPSTTTKRKCNEGARGSGQHKKSRAPFSLRALKEATELMSSSSRPSLTSSLCSPSDPLTVQATATTTAAVDPSTLPFMPI